jgi:hypothetical protein
MANQQPLAQSLLLQHGTRLGRWHRKHRLIALGTLALLPRAGAPLRVRRKRPPRRSMIRVSGSHCCLSHARMRNWRRRQSGYIALQKKKERRIEMASPDGR